MFDSLREYATVREHEFLDAIEETGSQMAAAKKLGVSCRAIERGLQRLRRRSARQGVSPEHDMTHPVPPGYVVKGVSTYYDQEGKVRGQWVKSRENRGAPEEIREAFLEAFRDDIPRIEPVSLLHPTDDQFLNAYVYGDPHVGMRAFRDEAGQDHDLKLAEALFTACHRDLVNRAPAASTAILLNLGDYFHADDGSEQTRSGHRLDVDGRYQKVRKVGFRIMRAMIEMCLQKHQNVIIWNIVGNHDDHSAIDLSLWLQVAYECEPRVQVETSPSKFYYKQFGNVMLAATHGDTVKPDQMAQVMACDQAIMWGQCTHRYAHLGHVHHKSLKDLPGVAVETHRILQPNDLWAHNAGYRSQRDAQCITYHQAHGEYARTIVNPSMA